MLTRGARSFEPYSPKDGRKGFQWLGKLNEVEHYLKENGIYVLETMNVGPLVRDEVFEFLFVLGQAKVRGAVQMIINPIAID